MNRKSIALAAALSMALAFPRRQPARRGEREQQAQGPEAWPPMAEWFRTVATA